MLQLKFKKQQQKQNKLENKYVAQRNLENEQKIENSEIKDYDDFLINLDMHFSNREPEESKSNQNKRTNQKQNNQNSSTIKKKPIKMNFCKLVERHRIVYIEDEKEGQTIDKSRNTNGNIKKITDALINNQNNLSDTQNKHQIQLAIIKQIILRMSSQ
ncbi:unnamed protein product (macronuclear) [Paramecium tetraurelia]|uniref:Uncharacterized protein n=1 Tax=Paramecium tetraurelia TaxID=5888 RepID=A0DZ85_PARTE|nr:uncharacterized protein GSPATT00003321001 [Paramecium tetraurelia]CAK88352.1 unnamed protein product [Paramecium tetraurelia]|eukprot:XP_001455749.1 hypothetical protein (macronuclear) [Paramecium tetraurelia strain d4-2]